MKLNHNNIQGSLQKKREELIKRFSEIDSTDFLAQHTRMIDEYFQQSYEASMVKIHTPSLHSVGMVAENSAFIQISTSCFFSKTKFLMQPII
jgi:hypothetical protein